MSTARASANWCSVTTSRQGGALKLIGLTKRLRDLLVLTKLVTVFDAFENEASALASF